MERQPQFYEFSDEKTIRGRWYLKAPIAADGTELDPRRFTYGKPVADPGELRLPLRRAGKPLDFTLADFGMPVVSPRLAMHLHALAPGAMQRFRVEVEGQDTPYEILNVTTTRRCFDEERSGIVWDDEVPGRYSIVVNPVVNPVRVDNAALFRVSGWEIMMICAAHVRTALVQRGYSGLRFDALGSSPV